MDLLPGGKWGQKSEEDHIKTSNELGLKSLQFTAMWLKPTHLARFQCKGGWEMYSNRSAQDEKKIILVTLCQSPQYLFIIIWQPVST